MSVVLPSVEDPVVRGASEVVGGPPGRHALLGERRFWTPLRWLVLLTLVSSLLGWWQKSPCRVQPWADQYQYTRGCYTDVFALYFAERLNEGKVPYVEHPVEYPVVIGAAMQVAATVVEVLPESRRPRHFYDVTWALLTACALVVVVTTAKLAGRRPWDAAIFAAGPLLVLHGTTNWDLIAMALAGTGLLLWARHRPLAAGVLLGLATATKLYPVLFLVPLLALCWRAGRLRAFAVTAGALVVTPVLVSLPFYLVSPVFADVGGTQTQIAGSPLDRFGEQGLAALSPHHTVGGVTGVNSAYRFFELNSTRPADWDSLWYVLQTARGQALDPPGQAPSTLNLVVALSFLLCLAGIVALVRLAPRRPRLAQVLFLTVLAFLLTNKVWSPQFSLWLLPLAALARPHWRSLLAWQAAEALVLLTRFYFFVGNGSPGDGIDVDWFFGALAVRDATLLVIGALVVRDVLQPDRDRVRADGTDGTDGTDDADGTDDIDDPMGGVLDGAPDRAGDPVRA